MINADKTNSIGMPYNYTVIIIFVSPKIASQSSVKSPLTGYSKLFQNTSLHIYYLYSGHIPCQ